jgi:non-ribosomal peptide synthetase-like protein
MAWYFASQEFITVGELIRADIIIYIGAYSPWIVLKILCIISAILFTSFMLLRFLSIIVVPRILNLFIREDTTYVLYGFRYLVFRLISGASNSYFFNLLFGDSSYILFYLNAIGFRASKTEQSGSNFGQSQKHDSPFLCATGTGTMVSDGLSMINADMSSNSFKLSKAVLGDYCFLGNNIHYPADAKIGNNCLMATKALIPIDGPIRENTGLLGSPAFEIPRNTDSDKEIETYDEPEIRQQRIHKKNIFNLFTMTSFLFFHWLFAFLSLAYGYFTIMTFAHQGLAVLINMLMFPVLTIGYFIFVEKLSQNFKRMQPKTCSIYDKYFWTVEHYWKHAHAPIMGLFKGTPYKNIISRLLGVKIGKMVFDDGGFSTEKSMVTIGDYCTLNDSCTLQSHSLEDGIFKSDYIHIGNGCTIGCNAYVHYDVTIEDNAILNPDSFLMKGERIASNSTWQGNPAKVS